MDLEQQTHLISDIRETLSGHVGERIKVRANMGRSKIIEHFGKITEVHPRLFIMEVDRKRGAPARQSFQYADVLTGMVELTKDGEKIVDVHVDETVPAPLPENIRLFRGDDAMI